MKTLEDFRKETSDEIALLQRVNETTCRAAFAIENLRKAAKVTAEIDENDVLHLAIPLTDNSGEIILGASEDSQIRDFVAQGFEVGEIARLMCVSESRVWAAVRMKSPA